MEATLFLCDQAQAVGGKLYVLGGGWDSMRRADTPSVLTAAGWIDVQPEDVGQFAIEVDFVPEDAEDEALRIGDEVVHVGAEIEIPDEEFPPTGTKRHIFALGFIGVPFPAGIYRCRLRTGDTELASSRFIVTEG